MPCPTCAPLLEASTDDRDRSELQPAFEVLQETVDKFDSCTMWWHGTARCRACGQRVWFEYRHGFEKTGRLAALP